MPKKRDEQPQIHVVETEYGQVLLNEADGAYLHLNETAAFIKTRLDAGVDTDTIATNLAEEYDVDPQAARADVAAFLVALEERGLR